MDTHTNIAKHEACAPPIEPPSITSLARPNKIWTLKAVALTLERYEPAHSNALISLLTSMLKGLQEIQSVSPRFAIQICSAVPINPWAPVSLPDCRITISLGEELPAPIIEADETNQAARERMYQILVGDRLNNPKDSTTINEFKALGTRGLHRKRILMRRLRWLRVYEQRMGYTEREDQLEWPLLKALEEGLQKELDSIDALLAKVADATGVGKWVYWLRSDQ
ncbi:uncharacterized protein LAJ45_05343 [Morchella importuna]|uniref:Uncharacterized protein n=1 Tax=Morchella conica CCBAS932 TaxID=1392247 RepID=A0A3N4KVS5_9PEZI|nr:uncharacterized protein LAJ45_05343 [Morchella importuna]KAH8150647.1 hypothetical protein LAJ45_05343 [Morchella importuna]RPB14630.1 hypothetical protein P167DRAFT_543754 [Morchella conica CCBAS932]